MKVYFVKRKSDGLIFNGFQENLVRQPAEGMLAVRERAAEIVGGAADDWVMDWADYEPAAGAIIRLIEADGQGGHAVVQRQRGRRHPYLLEDGLAVTLGRGWFPGCRVLAEDDGYTFASPAADTGVALDVVEDQAGGLELQPYIWDPAAETKGQTPSGLTVVLADVLRGVLPAGATSLTELEEE